MRKASVLFLAVCMLSLSSVAVAQEPAEAEHEEAEIAPPYNVAAVFLGNTNEESENGFSLGLEYERRVSDLVGVGALVERAGGDIKSTIAMATLYVHPVGEFYVIVGLGAEFKDAREEHGEEEQATSGIMGRIGIGYELELGRLVLVPQVNLDVFEREEALVVGAAFAYRF